VGFDDDTAAEVGKVFILISQLNSTQQNTQEDIYLIKFSSFIYSLSLYIYFHFHFLKCVSL
jgi:hypothetical protein